MLNTFYVKHAASNAFFFVLLESMKNEMKIVIIIKLDNFHFVLQPVLELEKLR